MFHSNTSSGNPADWSLIVVDTLEISSGTDVTVKANLDGTTPILDPVLVE